MNLASFYFNNDTLKSDIMGNKDNYKYAGLC